MFFPLNILIQLQLLVFQVPKCPIDYEAWLVTMYAEFGTNGTVYTTGLLGNMMNMQEGGVTWCQEMYVLFTVSFMVRTFDSGYNGFRPRSTLLPCPCLL